MARAAGLDGFHIWAQESIDDRFRSGLFEFPTLAAAMIKKGRMAGGLGRPGVGAVIGQNPTLGEVKSLSGSTLHHVKFQTGRVGGVKVLSADGTGSSAGAERSDKKWKSAYVHWTHFEAPITIRNEAIRQSKGGFSRGNIIDVATKMAVEELLEDVSTRLYTGNPSNQSTDEPWDNILGLDQWIDDDNTIGGINRSSVSGFSGVVVSTAKTAKLALIDEAYLNYDGSGTGMGDKGSRLDMIVTGNVLYNKLKQEALARGAQLISRDQPSGGKVGYVGEFIDYNGKVIVYDPKCAASTIYMLDSRSWEVQIDPEYNFKVSKFVNLRDLQPGAGQPDLTTAMVELRMRTICHEPWKNIVYNSVS